MGEVQELTLIDAAPATEADAQALCVELTMDETGLVTWLPVENAEADKLEIDKNGSMNMKTLYIQDTSFRLLEHYSLNVYPLFADGTKGISMRSAVFGGLAEEVSPLDYSAYQVYGLIPAIDPASFVTAKDSTVTFTATGPDGKTMRFEGKGISLTEDGISFTPEGEFMALDAIGTIVAINPAMSANDAGETAAVISVTRQN